MLQTPVHLIQIDKLIKDIQIFVITICESEIGSMFEVSNVSYQLSVLN